MWFLKRQNVHPPQGERNGFKARFPPEKRFRESERIRKKYPERIPVIVEKMEKSEIAEIDKSKYLVPQDLTIGQFIFVLRKRLQIPPDKAIFIFIHSSIPCATSSLGQVYKENKDPDGFLYVEYSGESTFG